MFWNKKKKGDKGLPDLPAGPTAAPSMRDFHTLPKSIDNEDEENSEQVHSLPSFPDSPMRKGFSQSAIKEAIDSPEQDSEDNASLLPSLPGMEPSSPKHQSTPTLPNMPKPKGYPVSTYPKTMPPPQIPRKSKIVEMDEWTPPEPPSSIGKSFKLPQNISSNKPIFVKIDKFRSARESLEEIKNKLSTVDELLKTIRDVKMQEEQEISSWEKDIESIKSRISTISSEIFDNALENS